MYVILRPLMPPCELTYLKNAFDAGAISLYPGAAGPVSGWWLPIVTVVFVTPSEDLPPPPPPHPAAASPAAARTPAAPIALRIRALMVPPSLLLTASAPAFRPGAALPGSPPARPRSPP